VRRQPFIAFTALLVAGGAVLAWPSLGELARIPVPAGAVVPASAEPNPVATAPPVLGVESAAPSPNSTAEPAPTQVPIAGFQPRQEPALAPARLGDGLQAPDPGRLRDYRWPLANGRITGPFGPSPYGALLVDGGRFHDGLDIASFCGDIVMAAHDGRVLAAGRKFDPYIGWVGSLLPHTLRMNRLQRWYELPITVIVDDGDGYRAIYAHLNAVSVRPGQWVRAGQQIGWEGSTGFATGCHVHFGLFSPLETRQFELRPDVHKRTKYPRYEIARIDPLLVLPPLPPGKTAGPFPPPSLEVSPIPDGTGEAPAPSPADSAAR
jgi:murein DD-endopeptidase MepM/ murein hydrolase activator NlpD